MTRAVPAPEKPRPIPGRIGSVLAVVRVLIAHARHFATIAAESAAVPEFAAIAAVFGTYDVPVILHRVKRGLLRALALQKYLLERGARGRELRFAWPNTADLQPHHRPPPGPTRAPRPAPAAKRQLDPALLGPDDPAAYRMPTQEEADAWVRRRPVGRSMAYICLDLGLVPGLCDGAFWNKVSNVFRRYGGSINHMFELRAKRERTFQKERDRRPETWHIDWRFTRDPAVFHLLGGPFGAPEPRTDGPLPGLPAPVPS